MAESGLLASQSSLLHLPLRHSKLGFRAYATTLQCLRLQQYLSERLLVCGKPRLKPIVVAKAVASDTRASTILDDNAGLSSEVMEVEPETGGGGGIHGDIGNGWGGGGGEGGGGGWDDGKREGEGGSSENSDEKKKIALSMSHKLILGCAALVGMGGLMSYMESSSQKSLLRGALSAAVLYYVYARLPANLAFASSIGLALTVQNLLQREYAPPSGFSVEDSGPVTRLLCKAALVLGLLMWALSWALRLRNRAHLPPSAGGDSDSLILSPTAESVSDASDMCVTCLSQLSDGGELRELGNCRHVFHKKCIDRWLDHDQDGENHRTCPLCRAPMRA